MTKIKEGQEIRYVGYDGCTTVAIVYDVWETGDNVHVETEQGEHVVFRKEDL